MFPAFQARVARKTSANACRTMGPHQLSKREKLWDYVLDQKLSRYCTDHNILFNWRDRRILIRMQYGSIMYLLKYEVCPLICCYSSKNAYEDEACALNSVSD